MDWRTCFTSKGVPGWSAMILLLLFEVTGNVNTYGSVWTYLIISQLDLFSLVCNVQVL